MPKSKRNKQVDLTKAKKHGQEGKKKLFEEVRACVESYAHVFIFSVNDMRNSKIKSVREQWRHSRFFIGKNKVMALALGLTPASEFRQNLHKIGERLKGERGLLFSNKSVEEVLKWFSSYSEGDYARSGNLASETVNLKEGPLSQFPHNLEPYLRQLGLPTTLNKGVVHLISDHTVCNVGDVLTPETAKIVKLLGYEMAEFSIKIECVWTQDGTFVDLSSGEEYKENMGNLNVSALNGKETDIIDDDQDMEVDNSTPLESNEVEKAKSKIMRNGWLVEEENNSLNTADANKMAIESVGDEDEEESEDSDDEVIPNLVEDEGVEEIKDLTKVNEEEAVIQEITVSEDIENKSKMENIVEDSNKTDSENVKEVEVEENVQLQDAKDLMEVVAHKKSDISENLDSPIDNVEKIENKESSTVTELSRAQSSLVDLNIIQSPLLVEKRPKFSPRVTRSVKKAKKPTSQITEDKKKIKENSKKKGMSPSEDDENKSKMVNIIEDSNKIDSESANEVKVEKNVEIQDAKDLVEEVAFKSQAQSSLNDSNAVQSPLLVEKRPKFSPRVTRSVKKAKKVTSKLTKDESESKINFQENGKEKVMQTNEVSDQDIKQKKSAHKRHSTSESPIELKLRNRSVKSQKNKK